MGLDGKTKKTLMLIFILSLIAIILLIPNISMADIDPDDYSGGLTLTTKDINTLVEKANPIVSALRIIGIVVAAVTTVILGIKYMLGSTEEKAEYKKTMIPYIIGVILVVATTQLLSVFIGLVEQIE